MIVSVEAQTASLNTGVNQAIGHLERFNKTVSTIGGLLAGAFSASAIADVGRQALETASHFQDLADRIGISAEAVQRLDFAASQGGSSIDAVAASITKMSHNLTGGGKGTVDALDRLNLSLDTLRASTPDAAFEAIAEAIRKVPDPIRQASLATDLFGRGSAQLLPAIKAGFKAVGDQAPLMSNHVVEAGDVAGDKINEMHRRMNALKANALIPLMDKFTALPTSVQVASAGLMDFAQPIANISMALTAAGGLGPAIGVVSSLLTVTLPAAFAAVVPFLLPAGVIIGGIVAIYEAWKHWDDIAAFFRGAWKVVEAALSKVPDWLLPLAGPIGMVVLAFRKWDEITGIAQAVYTGVKTWLLDKFAGVVESIRAKVAAVSEFFRDMYDKIIGHSYVPNLISGIEQHFSRLGAAMVNPSRDASRAVMSIFDDMAEHVSKSLGKKLFGTNEKGEQTLVGGLLSGGIAAAISAGAGALMNFIGGIGGPSKQEKSGRSASDEFTRQMAGMLDWMERIEVHQLVAAGNSEKWATQMIAVRDAYLKAGHTAEEAAAVVDRLWKAEKQGGNAVQVVIDEITRAMHDTLPAATDVAADHLGVLGSVIDGVRDGLAQPMTMAVDTSQIAAAATQLANLDRMRAQILGDQAIARVGAGGFGSGYNPLNYDEWLAANPGGRYDQWVTGVLNDTEHNGMDQAAGKKFAGGTGGAFLDFGSGTAVTLHGRERVMTESEGRSEGSLLDEIRALRRELPRAIKIAMRDGLRGTM